MKTWTMAVVAACIAAAPIEAGDTRAAALEEHVLSLAAAPGAPGVSATALRLALEAGSRYLDGGEAAAAPIVYAAAVRAELHLRLGATVPRVRAALAQELRVAARAGVDPAARVRLIERVRRNLERAASGPAGLPWWNRPGGARGRTGG